MALARGRRLEPVNYWPGFVDALSTMLLVIIFLLSVFMLAQFFLSREVTGKDTALEKLKMRSLIIPRLATALGTEFRWRNRRFSTAWRNVSRFIDRESNIFFASAGVKRDR